MSLRLKVETDARGCQIYWLNRAEKRNALDEQFLQELLDAALHSASDPNVRVIVIRSTSPIFCAGADLNDWADVAPAEARRLSLLGSKAFQVLADVPMPVIAAIEGAALGGGLELAMACDIRIGSLECSVGYPEPRLGNSPAWGGMARLIEAIGKSYARSMLLTGDSISGTEAHRVGILQRLYRKEDFQSGLDALIGSILECDPDTLGFIKALFGQPAQIVAVQEAATAGYVSTRIESRERKAAFLAKRRVKV